MLKTQIKHANNRLCFNCNPSFAGLKFKPAKLGIHFFTGIFIALTMMSCSSEYLNLEIKTDGTMAWNKDSTAFVFVAEKRLYKMPRGIAKFPDGGKSKNVYLDFSLYYYSLKNNKLTNIGSLNNFYNKASYSWLDISQVRLSLTDSFLFFKMPEPSSYDLKALKERAPQILDAIRKIYKIDLQTFAKDTVEAVLYNRLFDKKRESFPTELYKRYLKKLSCSDWGIDIREIYPQTEKVYTDYIVKKEGNKDFRDCALRQIISGFSQKERKSIIGKMQKHKQELYDDYLSFDEKKDPYRKGMAKDKYEDYKLYMNEIEKKLSNY